jgi:hypothetical protein
MAAKNPFLLYLRSRLNGVVAIACGALFLVGLVFFRGNPAAVAGGAAVLYGAATAILFFSRRGAAAVVAETEQDMRAANLARLAETAKLRDRLAVMRIGDEGVRQAVELVLLVSGQYLERARELASWSPRASDQVRQALEICQAFLGELDESSTERRYGTADGDEGAEVRGRTIEALKACAGAIRSHGLADLGGLDGTEAIAVIEETEGRK